MKLNPSEIKGFNYQPSNGTTGLELWMNFNPSLIEHEIALGVKYFPRMNAIRFWLSYDAYNRNPVQFMNNFETALSIFNKFNLQIMPVLFNRWHNAELDYGGIYIDGLLGYIGDLAKQQEKQNKYLQNVIGEHANDPRIFCWDLCNEPNPVYHIPELARIEMDWLKRLYLTAKEHTSIPITIGSHAGCHVATLEPISDWLSIHPYLTVDTPENREKFKTMLDEYVEVACKAKKPLIATETCWGSLSGQERVENGRFTLSELKKRNIGWLVYLLHHSLIADAHRPEYGPVGAPGNLSFIEADGSLRPGHDFFNDY